MARFYSNENFPLPVVHALRAMRHDVLTTHDAGKSGLAIPDEEVLAFAVAHERSILTLNRKHFVRLHGESTEHCGIIVCTVDADFAGQANRIHAAVMSFSSLRNELIRINRPVAT
jgi:hypothetical protein